jgi:acetyl-CoA acetyltransferase
MVDSRDLAVAPRRLPRVAPLHKFENKVVISGIGLSSVGRRLGRNPLGLMIDACLAAIADAGLQAADIDGMSSYPGPSFTLAGTTGGGVNNIEDVLRLRPIWFASGMEGAGQTGAVVNAMLAVAAGMCRHVLCVRGVWESSFQDFQRRGEIRANAAGRISGEMEGRLPYGAFSAANWIAMMATRHMQAFGTTRAQLGAIAVNARRNASLNPNAVYRDPITMDDYLGARMVSTPFGLFDCDAPCDGAVAVVISSVDTIADLRPPFVGVEAVGTHLAERVSWDQGTLLHEPVLAGPARHVWTRTDLTHGDVDVAEIYDGFTFNCLSWIELLGFCGIGEGGPFVEGGHRIALDGDLPLNTHGGQLSAGRLHGWGFLHEACVQLRGEGGDRQVAGDPEVAILSSGGGHPGGVMLLTRWR